MVTGKKFEEEVEKEEYVTALPRFEGVSLWLQFLVQIL